MTFVAGSFLLRFEQAFMCGIYFISFYIIPVGLMLFNNFSADVNLDFFNILLYCSIVLTKFTSLYRNEKF